MNVAYALGYVPQHEGWEYLYMVIIGWSALIMFAGLLFDTMRDYYASHQCHHLHWSIHLTIGLGFLSLSPYGLMGLFSMNVVLRQFATLSACLLAATFTILAIVSFIYNMFGEEFWKTVKQAR